MFLFFIAISLGTSSADCTFMGIKVYFLFLLDSMLDSMKIETFSGKRWERHLMRSTVTIEDCALVGSIIPIQKIFFINFGFPARDNQ